MLKIRIKRVLLILFLLTIRNLIIIIVLLNSSLLQSYLAKKCIDFFANTYNLTLTIEDVYLELPNKLVLTNVELLDSCGENILSAKKFTTELEDYNYKKNRIIISQILLEQPEIIAEVDSSGIANYDYILRKFSQNVRSDINVEIACRKVAVSAGKFKYRDQRYPVSTSFVPTDFEISDFNAEFSRFRYINDTLKVKIDNFSLDEKSGIKIEEISTKALISPSSISLNNLIVRTQNSFFSLSELSIKGEDSTYLVQPLEKNSAIHIGIDTAILCISDLAPFAPDYSHITDSVKLHGTISGKISDLKFKDFLIAAGKNTILAANLSVNGLPDIEQTIVFGKISKFHTTQNDIERIIKVSAPEKNINLPENFKSLAYISYNGNITGLLNDIVLYGQLRTNLGIIKTDIALMPNFSEKSMQYSGKIETSNFDIGKIVPNKIKLGLVSLMINIDGTLDSLQNTTNDIKGQVTRLDFNNYSYSNILLDGQLTNTEVNANIDIKDPNIQLELMGKYNFGKRMQLISRVSADLKALNLASEEIEKSDLRFTLISNLEGDLTKQPIGEILLNSASYNIDNKYINLSSLIIECSKDNEGKHQIQVRSDFFDLNLYGEYVLDEVIPDVYNMLGKSLPTLTKQESNNKIVSNNYFNYSFRLKRLNDFTKFIDKDIEIKGDIYANNGYVFCNTGTLYGKINLPPIKRKGVELGKSDIEITYLDGKSTIYFNTNYIRSSWRDFEEVKMNLSAMNDSLNVNLNWGTSQTATSGFLQFDTRFLAHSNDSQPRIETILQPAQIVFGKGVWQLSQSQINYDNREIEIENFKITNANQSLSIKGNVSSDKEKLLSFILENVDLSNLNQLTHKHGYEFGGILSGSGRIANLYNLPIFSSNISIDNLHINQEDIGRLTLSSKWDNIRKAFIIGGTNKFLELKANYHTVQDSLDATVMLKNFKLDIFDKYLTKYEFTGVKGEANGILAVTGSFKQPQLNGEINLNQTEFIYNYLKLKAITEDKVYISNDGFYFKDFEVSDDEGNLGLINGGIYHNNFRDFKFDLDLNLTDYRIMNTRLSDNDLFYGTVYASGGAKIEGSEKGVSVYAGARTERGSKFVMPMEESFSKQELNYLTFLTAEESAIETEERVTNKSLVKYGVKLDVEVTPETEIQIVFDQQSGDRIKANSKGKLNIEFNSDEEIYLYGDIEISKGDYLFTLENIINKRFTITPGGHISWSGNPYEGRLDLDAVYSANVSLKELMREEYDTTDQFNMKANVECHMHLNGELMSPEIQFSINIPNANDKIKTKLASLTQDEINKQLLYVLVLNQFYDQNSEILSQTGTTTNAVGVTTTEMLSNQLSNWLSQITKDIDVGFKYSPGTELSGREIELALSTQIFNERLLINGNLGISDKKYNNENLVGDVEVQWKINQKGTLRLRGFTRKNTDLESEYGPYTTGAGIFYTEEFDTWGELCKKIWNAVTFKNAREKRKSKKGKAL